MVGKTKFDDVCSQLRDSEWKCGKYSPTERFIVRNIFTRSRGVTVALFFLRTLNAVLRRGILVAAICLNALPASASEFQGPCDEVEFYVESSAFVSIPAQVGGCALGVPGLIAGGVVGIPIGIVLMPTGIANPFDASGALMVIGAGLGNAIGGGLVGLPFWLSEQLIRRKSGGRDGVEASEP